jgi:hypothetical protein
MAEFQPGDLENGVPLAEMEVLHGYLLHQLQKIELGEFVQEFTVSRVAVALEVFRLCDAYRSGFQDVRVRVFVVINHGLGTVQAPAAGNRAHDHRQHVVQPLADAGVVGLVWDFGHS